MNCGTVRLRLRLALDHRTAKLQLRRDKQDGTTLTQIVTPQLSLRGRGNHVALLEACQVPGLSPCGRGNDLSGEVTLWPPDWPRRSGSGLWESGPAGDCAPVIAQPADARHNTPRGMQFISLNCSPCFAGTFQVSRPSPPRIPLRFTATFGAGPSPASTSPTVASLFHRPFRLLLKGSRHETTNLRHRGSRLDWVVSLFCFECSGRHASPPDGRCL